MTHSLHLIIPQNFSLPAWQQAWPNALVIHSTDIAELPSAKMVVTTAALDQWQAVVTHYSQQSTPVLVLSSAGTLAEFKQAMLAGARGYIDALSPAVSLQNASQSIMSGALWVPPALLNSLISTLSNVLPETTRNPFAQLTDREQQVAQAVCKGLSNKVIANQLDISERTVKLHLTSTFTKLGVKDRMQLLLLSRQA